MLHSRNQTLADATSNCVDGFTENNEPLAPNERSWLLQVGFIFEYCNKGRDQLREEIVQA